MSFDRPREETAAIRTYFGAIFVSLELSRKTWLIASLSPGGGEKMSRHSAPAGEAAGLPARFAELRGKAVARTGTSHPIIVIQAAGLDGFWIDRVLRREGIESQVVDAASIAVSRRRRRAKRDKIDGEALARAPPAFKRGEPRVRSMARAPTPEEEDRRRICRARQAPIAERARRVDPRRMRSVRPAIEGLLFSQGIGDYEPLRRDRRRQLASLRAGDGRALGPNLKAQIGRELDRLELPLSQIEAVAAARDALLAPAVEAEAASAPTPSPARTLLRPRGVGAQFAVALCTEGLRRSFSHRRQAAAFAGLAATPWRSGTIDGEQGVSKAGDPRLRTTMIQLAWRWLRHQPQSALARWFRQRLAGAKKGARKTPIVALARKLLAALWKYVAAGVVVEGAVMKDVAANG